MRHLKRIISTLILTTILFPLFSEEITFRSCDFYSVTSEKNQDYDDDSPDWQELGLGCLKLIFFLSFLNNFIIEYDEYPYANDNNNYITLSPITNNTLSRPFRFAFDTSVFYQPKFGIGAGARFEGIIYKFLGPVFEYSQWTENKSMRIFLNENENTGNIQDKGNLRLGAQFSFIQISPISIYWLFQWSHLFDSNLDAQDKNAFLIGMIIRLYPVKPLLLELRGTIQYFSSDKVIYESHMEVGFMVKNRWEIFGAWNSATDGIYDMKSNNLEIGTRIHF